jgi:hypothetical protein
MLSWDALSGLCRVGKGGRGVEAFGMEHIPPLPTLPALLKRETAWAKAVRRHAATQSALASLYPPYETVRPSVRAFFRRAAHRSGTSELCWTIRFKYIPAPLTHAQLKELIQIPR